MTANCVDNSCTLLSSLTVFSRMFQIRHMIQLGPMNETWFRSWKRRGMFPLDLMLGRFTFIDAKDICYSFNQVFAKHPLYYRKRNVKVIDEKEQPSWERKTALGNVSFSVKTFMRLALALDFEVVWADKFPLLSKSVLVGFSSLAMKRGPTE